MGSVFSFIGSYPGTSSASSLRPSLGDLPESCVASVLVYLDPPQICKLARLNRAFRGASSADFVWESKLPLNYKSVIERVFNRFPTNLCKREIYARLCRSNSFDSGTKKVWLDKGTGMFCLSISSNGLAITGIDDRRYWTRIQTDESRFRSVAYLQQIWWLEVDGEVEFPLSAGRYSLFFRLQLGRAPKRYGRRVCDSDHVHGWDKKPVQFQVQVSGQQHAATTQCYLEEPGKWMHYHAGDFVVEDSNALSSSTTTTTRIKFSMTQIDCTQKKGGLCVDSVLIYPSQLKESL